MAEVLSHQTRRDNIIVIGSLIASIVVVNLFVIFPPYAGNGLFYFSGLTSTVTIGVALVVSIVMVYKYKGYIKKQEDKPQALSKPNNETGLYRHYYYDNNKMHFSICLFLLLWFIAQVIWTFGLQQSNVASIADALWYIGYASFGYFLYSWYYHFFRKEFEPLIPVLIAVVIFIALIFVIDSIVSTIRLLSNETVEVSMVLGSAAYPILDAIMIFPLAMIFWAVRRINNRNKNPEEQESKERDRLFLPIQNNASIWILLLFNAMILSAAGDSGYAYATAFDVHDFNWVWDILYNSDHLCIAAALIGYKHFFSFKRIDELKH